MFREMRRKNQRLTETECVEILHRNTAGVLAVLGDEGYPYAVPMSYVYDGEALYFHCAKSGHKLDAIKSCDKVSFCVIDQDEVVPQKYTTHFRSVVLFGRASILNNDEEVLSAIGKLAIKYHPTDSKRNRDIAIKKEYSAMCIIKIDIAHMTGKESIELVKAKYR
ncbi:MAG: pyridoxamine 5'-phosphate oxidase family protein [Clostridiales bacterium]|nr:pyridoxamine 5'-phosphate oxidase family protein [Clostridiales bacterium]